MNRFCYIRYEKSDSNDISAEDFGSFRVVLCSFVKYPGFFMKRKLKKFTDGFCCFDEYSIADNLFCPKPKELFKNNFTDAVVRFSEIYGVKLFDKEVFISFDPGDIILKKLCECFSMVYIFASKRSVMPYNAFFVSDVPKRKFDFSLVDRKIGGLSSDYMFNLSDYNIPGAVNDIQTIADSEYDIIPSSVKNSVFYHYGIPFEIIGFV